MPLTEGQFGTYVRLASHFTAAKSPSSDEKKIFPIPFFSSAVNLGRCAITRVCTSVSRSFSGGLNKKYQCLTVWLRPPLPTGILECSLAHIGYSLYQIFNFQKRIYNDRRQNH